MVGNWVTFSAMQTPGQSQQFTRDSKTPWTPRRENKYVINSIQKKKKKSEMIEKGSYMSFFGHYCIDLFQCCWNFCLLWCASYRSWPKVRTWCEARWAATDKLLEHSQSQKLLCVGRMSKSSPKINNPFESRLSAFEIVHGHALQLGI